MQSSGCFLSIFLVFSYFSASYALSSAEESWITHRQLLSLEESKELPPNYENQVDIKFEFPNSRLRRAYIALEALKKAIYSDPLHTTSNWVGPDVCEYTGVFCSPALDDPKVSVVAGIDLNHADIAGYLPVELGLLTDVALFHINSNRFCGIIPKTFSRLTLMHELDVSNNRFVGPFLSVVLEMHNLKFLDIRFNNFQGELPPELFDMDLDALFLNDNLFTSHIPENLGNSPVSVLVLANNKIKGCIPKSIGKMSQTLNEIVLLSNELSGCLPSEVGLLGNATVVNLKSNSLSGVLPKTLKGIGLICELDVSDNMLTGFVSESICKLQITISTVRTKHVNRPSEKA